MTKCLKGESARGELLGRIELSDKLSLDHSKSEYKAAHNMHIQYITPENSTSLMIVYALCGKWNTFLLYVGV